MEKAIYKVNLDFGRNGNLYGLILEEKRFVKKLIEEQINIYFGEVLGKHSEIEGIPEESDFQLISDNPEHIKVVEELSLCFGVNPFDEYVSSETRRKYNLSNDNEEMQIRDVISILLKNES